MGCVRCGRRRVDPERGASAWRRAVRDGEQVLVCPECQVPGWTDGLDSCERCRSTMLAKQLGLVVCRSCGATGAATGGTGAEAASSDAAPEADDTLAAEVAAALDRVLRGE